MKMYTSTKLEQMQQCHTNSFPIFVQATCEMNSYK